MKFLYACFLLLASDGISLGVSFVEFHCSLARQANISASACIAETGSSATGTGST